MLDKLFSHCGSVFFFSHSLVLLFSETVFLQAGTFAYFGKLHVLAQERSDCCKVVFEVLQRNTDIVVTSHVTMSLNLAHACSVLDFANL